MPLDPSIALQAGQGVAPVDPMALYTKFAGLRNLLDTNDSIKANTANTQQSTATAQQAQAQSASVNVAQKMGQFLALPSQYQTQAIARQLVDHSLQEGSITPQVAAVWHDKINGTQNQADLQNLALRGIIGNLGGPEALKNTFGENTLVNTGGEIQPAVIQPAWKGGGLQAAGSAMINTLSPTDQNTLTNLPVMDPVTNKPTGATRPVTGRDVARMSGNSNLLPGGAFGGNNGRPPPATAPAPNVTPPAVTPAVRGPVPSAGVPSSIPTPSTPMRGLGQTLTPGEAAAIPEAARQNVAMAGQLNTAAEGVPAQHAMLAEMLAALNHFTTGQGQSRVLDMKGYVQAFAPRLAATMGIKPEELASAETFHKLAQQVALAQAGQIGAGTDASRTLVFGGNPNMDLSKMGNEQILHMLQGNADSITAKRSAWLKYAEQNGDGSYAKFSDAFNKTFDPRMYQMRYYTPAERSRMMDGMGASDKAQFLAKLAAAQQ